MLVAALGFAALTKFAI